jgi:hypothetical protein
MMQQLIDRGLLLSATAKPGAALVFEDSDSFLLRFKVVNDSAGHLTLTIKEAAGLIEKAGEMYCNLDVKYKKSEISLTTNVWKTQLCKGPVPKWNATFKYASFSCFFFFFFFFFFFQIKQKGSYSCSSSALAV